MIGYERAFRLDKEGRVRIAYASLVIHTFTTLRDEFPIGFHITLRQRL